MASIYLSINYICRCDGDILEVESISHPMSRGKLSSCHLVHVTATDNTDYRLFFKMVAVTAEGRSMAAETRVMEREVEALLHLAPMLRRLTLDKQIVLPLPEVVYGSYSNSGDGVLVCLDLLSNGYTRLPSSAGLPIIHLISAVESMARFHAVASVAISSDPTAFKNDFSSFQVNYFDSDVVYKHVNPLFKEFSSFIRRVPGFYDQFTKFEAVRGSAWGLLSRAAKRQPKPPLLTVTHGNLIAENLLYKDRSMVAVDWKCCGLGSSMKDIAMLLTSSSSSSTREVHTRQLLESYYFIYCQTLAKLGVNVKIEYPEFTIEALVEEYQRCLFGAFLQTVCLFTEQLRDLESEFISGGDTEKAGMDLREVGRRAVDLMDEVSLKLGSPLWTEVVSEVEESSSLTIKIPHQQNKGQVRG